MERKNKEIEIIEEKAEINADKNNKKEPKEIKKPDELVDFYKEVEQEKSKILSKIVYQNRVLTLLEHYVHLYHQQAPDNEKTDATHVGTLLKITNIVKNYPWSYHAGTALAMALELKQIHLADTLFSTAVLNEDNEVRDDIDLKEFQFLINEKDNQTVLSLAIVLCNQKSDEAYVFIKKLIKCAVALGSKDFLNNLSSYQGSYYSPLQLAIKRRNLPLINLFLDKKANLFAKGLEGAPLFFAAREFYAEGFLAILNHAQNLVLESKQSLFSEVNADKSIASLLCEKLKSNDTRADALKCMAAFLCAGGPLPVNPKDKDLLHKYREALFDACENYINDFPELYDTFNKRLLDKNDLSSIFYENTTMVKLRLFIPFTRDTIPQKIADFRAHNTKNKDGINEQKFAKFLELYNADYKKGNVVGLKNVFSTGKLSLYSGEMRTYDEVTKYAAQNKKSRTAEIVNQVEKLFLKGNHENTSDTGVQGLPELKT